jgi:membrane protein DedA with SNARE-associated domain
VLAGTLGNFVGNLIGFWIGVKLGRKALENFLQRHGKNLTRLDAIKKWFNRYGAAIVFVARWFGPIRTPVILGAGILDMPPYTYAFYSLAGSFSWTLFWQYICWKGMGAFIYWWHEYGIKGLIVAVLITLTFMGFYRYIRLRSIRRHDVQD